MTDVPLVLLGLTGDHDYPVAPGRPLVVGRGPAADLVLHDSAVSRTHAEIQATPEGLRLRDLGSANGTRLNGVPVTETLATPGDVISFGRPSFRVAIQGSTAPDPPGGRVVSAGGSLDDAEGLDRLLELARRLTGTVETEPLVELIGDLVFDLVPADRVAILLRQGEGTLVPVHGRSRVGPATAVRVPARLADQAATEGRPVVTADALDDAALRSGSVVASRVRSAIAAPMAGVDGAPVGVVYADRISTAVPFTDAEARTVLAFAALAGASVARAELAAALRRQDERRRNLERFLAPEVARVAEAAGMPLGPGGERRTVTVLFNDIRGFTSLAEGLAPEVVADLLTRYFTVMAGLVFAHGGMLDKYLGDGLLAVWGAPFDAPDHAARALDAARAMREAMTALNQQWAAEGIPALAVGAGLAHGEVFAGRIGSEHRLDYTVIGDTVNVAARLCALAGPGQILVTDSLRNALGGWPGARPHPGLEVRGRAGAISVWEV